MIAFVCRSGLTTTASSFAASQPLAVAALWPNASARLSIFAKPSASTWFSRDGRRRSGDTAVRALVDVLVLLLQPETGDDLQWEKAGLLEVADLVVIHKADMPGRSAWRLRF